MQQNIISSVLAALIVGILVAIWSWADRGGLVEALQGVTKKQLDEHAHKVHDGVPAGAIILTALECAALGPDWNPLDNAGGRFPVAAGTGIDINGKKYSFPINGKDDIGEYQHTLSIDTMPEHDHVESQYTKTADTPSKSRRVKVNHEGIYTGVWKSGLLVLHTETEGKGLPHNNIPPYIILNFCTKANQVLGKNADMTPNLRLTSR